MGSRDRAASHPGRRRALADTGRIETAAHLLDAGYAEMRSLIESGAGPSARELRERAEYRASCRAADAPARLGGDALPTLSLDEVPPADSRAMRALRVVVGRRFEDPTEPSDVTSVRGLAASPGVYEGTSRVIANPAELGRLQPGDVLVTHSTTESFGLALPLLGAIVTNPGGMLSHPAIVAREYGIPAIVGSRQATRLIPDGARVRASVGVVTQVLVDADVAGVLFTRNPVDGADERVVEASWGVGETVVTGRVVPDRFRISRSGDILERTAGFRDIALRRARTAPPTSGEWRPSSSSDCASRTLNSETSADSPSGARRCSARHATSSGGSPAERSTSSNAGR